MLALIGDHFTLSDPDWSSYADCGYPDYEIGCTALASTTAPPAAVMTAPDRFSRQADPVRDLRVII
jgi:hypothetical protein